MRKTFEVAVEPGELRSFVFRVPETDDLWRVFGSLPIFTEDGAGGSEAVAEATRIREALREAELGVRLLVECSISPRLVLECELELRAGTFPVRELPLKERQRVVSDLLEASGFSEAGRREVSPLSATGTGS